MVWHDQTAGASRDAVQALIQFAAAAHKIEQVRSGRSTESMLRGMEKLIGRARELLDGGGAADISWDVASLESALDDLDAARCRWSEHRDVDRARDEVATIARRLVSRLDA